MTRRAFRPLQRSTTPAAASSALQLHARGPVSSAGYAVQLDRASPGKSGGKSPQDIAASGFAGGGGALPHKEKIEASFGQDMSGVKAFTGPAASQACEDLGANAYAMGDKVAFKEAPSVQLAAHEAAHAVQQGQGVSLSGGMGKQGDKYEKAADQAGDLVAAGKSAAGLLGTDKEGGAPGKDVQKKASGVLQFDEAPKEKKTASARALTRLGHSRAAIKHTKSVLKHGAGNQKAALEASNFNSYWRLAAMRDKACWEIDPSVMKWARLYPEAMTAAKADLAGGGNCGEHAAVAFDYLRVNASGEKVNRVAHTMDHAFVLVGDLAKDDGSEIVACDPWPTKPTACLWEDHFAYTTDPNKLKKKNTVTADDKDVKAIILKGLKLSKKGEMYVKYAYDAKGTKEAVEDGRKEYKVGSAKYPKGRKRWIWIHPNAATKEYDYVPAKEVATAPPDKIEPAPDAVQDEAHTQDSGWGRFLGWIRSWFS
jgi:hypothetical protein